MVEVDHSDSDYAFSKTLNRINPTSFSVNKHQMLIIYVFPSNEDVAIGIKEFEEKTATANLVAYEKYVVNNLLIFYITGKDSNDTKVSDVIEEILAKN